ncbi:MAG: hypothetical protein RL490_1962 [Pseudomonadota bacterium]|jgi:MYXO-CTERM domain-containing protein
MAIVTMAILLFLTGKDVLVLPHLPAGMVENGPWLLLVLGLALYALRDRRRRSSFPESSS